jgi:hypothetical protein
MSDEPKVGFTGDPVYFDGTRVLQDKKAAMMQPLVDRTMEVMRKRGIHVPSDWRIPVAAAKINVEPEIPVTEEMIQAVGNLAAISLSQVCLSPERLTAIYRAMAAKAPRMALLGLMKSNLLTEEAKDVLTQMAASWQTSHNDLVALEHMRREAACAVIDREDRIAALESENAKLRLDRDLWHNSANQNLDFLAEEARFREIEREDARDYISELVRDIHMLKADKLGDVPYHGPTRPVTDKDGEITGREAAPDPSHERFHGSIGDVLSGNIIRPARDQMERALADARAKDSAAPKSLPGITRSDDPRRIGG